VHCLRAYCCAALFLAAATLARGATSAVVEIPSPSMRKQYKATVILPDTYSSSRKRYSTVYLLHGYSQDHTVWPKVAPLARLADTYQFIFVCPDGNYSSWYLDSPAKSNSKFETYIAREVPDYIDSSFRTIASYEGRALVGSSMGGHGALSILMKHPDRFAAATSISGILDLCAFPGRWDIARTLGPHEKNRTVWIGHSVSGLVDIVPLRNRHVFIDCGLSDPALRSTREVHAKLCLMKIPHDYRESPGGHTPHYVREAVEYHILYLSRILKRPAR